MNFFLLFSLSKSLVIIVIIFIALHVYRSMCEVLPNSELVQLNACTSGGFIFSVNQILFLVPRRVIVLEKEQDDLRA